jgi:hypothetical protein
MIVPLKAGEQVVDDSSYGFTWELVPPTDGTRKSLRCVQFPEARVFPPPTPNRFWFGEFPGLRMQVYFTEGDCFGAMGHHIATCLRRPADAKKT